MLEKALGFTAIVLLIAGCGASNSTPKTETKYFVPTDCANTKILASLPPDIKDPKWIDTKWQPAPDTDLYKVLNSGGIACTYGNQSAEVGATIFWSPSNSSEFESLSKNWGMEKVDVPGVTEDRAYWLGNDATGADEIHRWSLNLLYKSIWIQVNASYVYSMEDALPLINAAIESLNRG